jgi:hypothetical protein
VILVFTIGAQSLRICVDFLQRRIWKRFQAFFHFIEYKDTTNWYFITAQSDMSLFDSHPHKILVLFKVRNKRRFG